MMGKEKRQVSIGGDRTRHESIDEFKARLFRENVSTSELIERLYLVTCDLKESQRRVVELDERLRAEAESEFPLVTAGYRRRLAEEEELCLRVEIAQLKAEVKRLKARLVSTTPP